MKYNYFIKECKYVRKINILGDPLEYDTTYVICRTFVWIWLAKLIPSLFIQYLWITNIKQAIEKLNNSESIEVLWIHCMPSLERFKYIDDAEKFLKQMKSFPNQFYTKI